MLRLKFGSLVALCLFCLAATASAEKHVVVFKETENQAPGFYVWQDADYDALNLPKTHHVVLTEEEVKQLVAGETLLISDRMPELSGIETAWGIAMSEASNDALYTLTMAYDNYVEYFPDVLECEAFEDENGVPRIVYIKKDAALDVKMVLDYTMYPGMGKEWKSLDEGDYEGYTEEQQLKIEEYLKESDFKINTGGWYFIPVDNDLVGTMKTVIVRNVAVKLGGFKGFMKGPKAVKKSTEKEMPETMKKLVELANKYAK